MQIMLRTGIALSQGTFSAVIAPEPIIIRAFNENPELGRFLFLFICGNYSRLISHISRKSSNFEVRRPFTADQLLNVIKSAGHTVIFIEHDPTLFESADRIITPVGEALKDAGREALVVLYSPTMDRSFAVMARKADRFIEIIRADEMEPRMRPVSSSSGRNDKTRHQAQRRLGAL